MIAKSHPHKAYWQAQGLVELALSRFQAAMEAGRADRQRSAFYHLAGYHGRTLRVLNSGLHRQDEALVQVALHNLLSLHRGMMQMHRTAPDTVPLPLALSEHSRDDFVRDLVMRVLAETPPALPPAHIHQRANHLDLLGRIAEDHVHHHLQTLAQARHVRAKDDGYVRTNRAYIELDKDVAGLRALIGRTFFARFVDAGYGSLESIDEQVMTFRSDFPKLTGHQDPHTTELFLNTVHMLVDTTVAETATWRYNDLLHSPYPRPYQRAAFDVFRRGVYQNQIIEAPTGSGKTLIGMMCIQDWLRTLSVGQSILVAVPTNNYQQQWIDELCYSPIGLQLPPEIIFAGTPADLGHYQELTGRHPAIVLITYAALSQLGSPTGKGGFDAQSIEAFLQRADVQHVILDEVHKVAEDMHSVTTDVTRLLVSWQQDTSLRGLIGFSGTAEAYRSRFDHLGLTLSYGVPMEDLVAAGFVAPFAELGVPFAYSQREGRIRELLEKYKDGLRRYFDLLGAERLRHRFVEISMERRISLGHDILGMYRGRSDWLTAIRKRFQDWETDRAAELKITEARLVTVLQIANGWTDLDLVRECNADLDVFKTLVDDLEAIKSELATLVYLPKTLARLHAKDFASALDAQQLIELPQSDVAVSARSEVAKDILATTIAGLYDGLSEWYLRTGEGRVATIKAIIEAEQATRTVSGTIIFDSGRHIPWRRGVSVPGYQGLAGLFSEMLGDERFTVMAALSNEMYLSHDRDDPLTVRIADYIRNVLMQGEVAKSIFNLLVSGLELSETDRTHLQSEFTDRFSRFVSTLEHMHAARPAIFNHDILRPLRRTVKRMDLGMIGDRLLARMDRRNVHLKRLIGTLFDYGLLAVHFQEAHVAEVEQVSGARRKFFVVTMPSGSQRKQLMYDLTARIVDEESLPVNLAIVSNWARTGWNVIQPNLLIDATATRNVTAWQQLRGRAIRAWHTWNNDCYRLLSILVGHHLLAEEESGTVPEIEDNQAVELDGALLALLAEIATPAQRRRLATDGVSALSHAERHNLAVSLLEKRNKVTHIYELVKATGSSSQVIYDRTEKVWRRREGIAAKHSREVSVNPFTGEKGAGDAHAPLIYAQDPRADVPAALQHHLAQSIEGCDDVIVSGWLQDGHGVV
jgi:superfamily II DNA or RNA helicase